MNVFWVWINIYNMQLVFSSNNRGFDSPEIFAVFCTLSQLCLPLGQVVRVGQEAKQCVPGVPSTVWSTVWCENFHRARTSRWPIVFWSPGHPNVCRAISTSLVENLELGISKNSRECSFSSHVDGQKHFTNLYQHVSSLYSTCFLCLFDRYVRENDGRGIQHFFDTWTSKAYNSIVQVIVCMWYAFLLCAGFQTTLDFNG